MKIEGPIPPLRQSVYEDMACSRLYVAKHVQGISEITNRAAERGLELHEVLAGYISHLVRSRRKQDRRFLDQLARRAAPDVLEILKAFRNNHAFDPNKIVATEFEIRLDENLEPVEPVVPGDGRAAAPKPVAYKGTLDLVQLHSVREAQITDWKSYFRVVEAESRFQSKYYALLLFCLNPSLQKIKFVLEFVRYRTARSVEYTRADVAHLKELAERERNRQRQLHALGVASPDSVKASPGRHCTWCPLLFKGCPLEGANAYRGKTPEELLGYVIWLREAVNRNTEVLKHWIEERGPVQYRDENGVAYAAQFSAVSRRDFPYVSTANVVTDWVRKHPDDQCVKEDITSSQLGKHLKAKKRSKLRARLEPVAQPRIETQLKIAPIELERRPEPSRSRSEGILR